MMPGFVDCHTHVVSYLLAGLREKHKILDRATSGNIGKEGCSQTLNLIANDKRAADLFTSYIVSQNHRNLRKKSERL
jgi:imidazolonepropionase-like amidohydrolase